MNRMIAAAAVLTVSWCAPPSLLAGEREPAPSHIVVRGGDGRTIQQAIDTVAPGGRVVVTPGVYHIVTPLTISKPITFIGGGARGDQRTELVGAQQSDVLPVDQVEGLINLVGSGSGKIQSLMLRGGHAAISRNDLAGQGTASELQDVVIVGPVRGIVWRSLADFTARDVEIRETAWHGISVANA